MYNNTFGNIFRLTSFGESHGKAIGGVIDGFPAGITAAVRDSLPLQLHVKKLMK